MAYAIAALIMMTLLPGCVKNEFTIDFEFPKDHIGNYLVTYYAWDATKGTWIETTAVVQNGVSSLDCITRRPTLVYISDASSPSNSMVIYAERGDNIRITGENGDMMSWHVKGNKLSEQWSDWRNAALKDGGLSDTGKRHKHISDFVTGNPKSPLSAIMLLTEWNRLEDPDGFVRLWNSIDSGSRTQETVEMCGAPDMTGVQFEVTADGLLEATKDSRLRSMILRTAGNGIDTLRFSKGGASLLYFYKDNNSDRRETVDTLRALVKTYPDSLKRIICDISVDTDSMTWVSSMRNDSLKSTVRGWMPRGMADEEISRAGVSRLPWFRVTGKDGKETYSGSDLKDAAKAFRKEMKASSDKK